MLAEEDYLQTLYWLFEAGLPMTGANVARAMQLSAPTVHEMIGRLERDGYVVRDAGRAIGFTPSGREHAEHIVSRHRMRAEECLVQVREQFGELSFVQGQAIPRPGCTGNILR